MWRVLAQQIGHPITEIKNNIIIYVLAVNYMVVKRLTFIPIQ